jgi:putative hydrolase of the HAD superfamily
MNVKAAFFDLDDTLCDDYQAWVSCSRKAARLAAEHNGAIDTDRLAETFLGISESYWTSPEALREVRPLFEVRTGQWREALRTAGYPPSNELAERICETYGLLRSTEVALFPDAVPTLEELRRRGVKLALITNGWQSTHVQKVESLGLEPHFDHVLIAGELGFFKPETRIFEHALNLCGCEASEAVMIGDDIVNDVGGAEAAGIVSIWFNPKNKPLRPGLPVPSGGQIRALSEVLDSAYLTGA